MVYLIIYSLYIFLCCSTKLSFTISNIQRNTSISSLVFELNSALVSDWCNAVLYELVRANINSADGINLVVEKSVNNPPLLNLNQPAIIRQYSDQLNKEKNTRFTYGASKSLGTILVGTDPNNFITRKMKDYLTLISNFLLRIM